MIHILPFYGLTNELHNEFMTSADKCLREVLETLLYQTL